MTKEVDTPTQAFFLIRLGDFSNRIRRFAEGSLSLDAGQKRLLEWARYSTFMDCIQLGVTDEAKEILKTNEPRSPEQK